MKTQVKSRNGILGVRLLIGTLVSGLLSSLACSVQAEETFGNQGIQFDINTVIEFEFIESHGAYQSTFGVVNLDTGEKTPLLVETKPSDNPAPIIRPSTYQTDVGPSDTQDFLGTPGNAVPNPITEFEFKAKTRYAFYLESTYNGQPAGIIYSTDTKNANGSQLVRFEGGMNGLADQGTTVVWDDTGSRLVPTRVEDRDFDDFVVRAGGHLACPYSAASVPTAPQASTSSGSVATKSTCR